MGAMAMVAKRPNELGSSSRLWDVACFGALPVVILGYAGWWVAHAGVRERDFRIFRTAALAVMHGSSPYPPALPSVLGHFDKFVYPPLSAFLFVPLAWLPLRVGELVMFALGIACILVALRLLAVKDWRCFGIALVAAPALNSILLGAVTSVLFLGTAATWRYRERAALSGVLAAAVSVMKLFLWPLGLWFVVTRRWRATLTFCSACCVLGLGAWGAIGFAGFRSYPELLRVLSKVEQARGYGVVSLAHVSGHAAEFLTLGLVGIVAIAVMVAARGPDADRRAFVVAVLGALIATPLLWLHYFVLLYVPIALYRPRLSGVWFLPLALWLTPVTQPQGSIWRICVALAVTGAVAASTVRRVSTPDFSRPSDLRPLQRGRNSSPA
jgi:alpha-1,2-mannosyltransferase